MSKLIITLTSNSTDLSDAEYNSTFELSENGFELIPITDTQIPWNAVLNIKNKNVILTGDVGDGGPDRGTIVMTIPVERFKDYVQIDLHPNSDEDEITLRDMFKRHNWNVK